MRGGQVAFLVAGGWAASGVGSRAHAAAAPAAEVPAQARPGSLMLGQGWGCVWTAAVGQQVWQCWTAAGRGGARGAGPANPTAWPVPWLSAYAAQAGADRICAVVAEQIHCWAPPARDDAGPRELRPPDEAGAIPSGRAPDADPPTFLDESALYDGFVGAQFACAVKGNDLWCAGDHRFGQLGYGAGPREVPPLLHLAAVNDVAVGTWHVCATGDSGPGGRTVLHCWGRDDGGQLGFAAPEACTVGQTDVPCARAPRPVPFNLKMLRGLTYAPNRPRGKLHAGDLFTCAWQPRAIVCWGASRDGLFGTPTQCPTGLRHAWPTVTGGAVAAPKAACSPEPVTVAGSDDARFWVESGLRVNGRASDPPMLTQEIDAGPRGLCLVSNAGEVWCRGAIASPRALGAKAVHVEVSRGDDAAACAILHDGRLLCWGEGYSPPRHPDRAVIVALTGFVPPPPVTNPNPAPIDSPSPADGLPWGKSCLINRECPVVALALATCPPELAAQATPIADVVASLDRRAGRTVSVRGPLALGHGIVKLPLCRELDSTTGQPLPVHGCCTNVTFSTIAVGAGAALVDLDGFSCQGDQSRRCCNVAVRQTVVATGTVQKNDRFGGWKLTGDVKLCIVPDAPQ